MEGLRCVSVTLSGANISFVFEAFSRYFVLADDAFEDEWANRLCVGVCVCVVVNVRD